MTLREYLDCCNDRQIIGHAIRYLGDGQFYIHPSGKDGITRDFLAEGERVVQDPSVTYLEEAGTVGEKEATDA